MYLLVDEIERHIDDENYLRNRTWAVGDSLEYLHYLPNRRIELTNMDGKIRSNANMLSWMKNLSPITIDKERK